MTKENGERKVIRETEIRKDSDKNNIQDRQTRRRKRRRGDSKEIQKRDKWRKRKKKIKMKTYWKDGKGNERITRKIEKNMTRKKENVKENEGVGKQRVKKTRNQARNGKR